MFLCPQPLCVFYNPISGSPVLHPGALHFFMSLHPEGKNALHPKWHFIQYATTSPSALRPEWHFIPSTLRLEGHFIPSTLHLKGHFISKGTSSQVHFISKGTSSHSVRHLISHFISQVISSHMLLHPIGHFIPPVISSLQGEHMTICVNYCIQGWISVVRTDI